MEHRSAQTRIEPLQLSYRINAQLLLPIVHIVVCFDILDNGDIEFIQVEIAELIGFEYGEASDWKYQGSSRNENDSQRTETYITTKVGTAKLRDGTVYLNLDRVQISPRLKKEREKVFELDIPYFSPFSK